MYTYFFRQSVSLICCFLLQFSIAASECITTRPKVAAGANQKVQVEDLLLTLFDISPQCKKLPKDLQRQLICPDLRDLFLGCYEIKKPWKSIGVKKTDFFIQVRPEIYSLAFSQDDSHVFFTTPFCFVFLDFQNIDTDGSIRKGLHRSLISRRYPWTPVARGVLNSDNSKIFMWVSWRNRPEEDCYEYQLSNYRLPESDFKNESHFDELKLHLNGEVTSSLSASNVVYEGYSYTIASSIVSACYTREDHLVIATADQRILVLDQDRKCIATYTDPLFNQEDDIGAYREEVEYDPGPPLIIGVYSHGVYSNIHGTIRRCDITTGNFETIVSCNEELNARMSPDGNHIVNFAEFEPEDGQRDAIQIDFWDVQCDDSGAHFEVPGYFDDLAFSEDSKFIIIIRSHDCALVCHREGGVPIAMIHNSSFDFDPPDPSERGNLEPAHGAFSHDGSLIVTTASEAVINAKRSNRDHTSESYRGPDVYLGVWKCNPHWKEFDSLFCGHLEIEQMCYISLLRLISHYNQLWGDVLEKLENKEDLATYISDFKKKYPLLAAKQESEAQDTPLSIFFRARFLKAIEEVAQNPTLSQGSLKRCFLYPEVIAALEYEWELEVDALQAHFKKQFLTWENNTRTPFHTYCLHVLGIPV